VDQITITLPDSSQITVESGSTIYDTIGHIGTGLQKAALAAVIDGNMVDLSRTLTKDCALQVYTFKDEKGKNVYWHTSSHILAQAVTRLFPDAQYAIGPAIADGFYYDFDVAATFSPGDLEKIAAEMNAIIKEDLAITREELPIAEAKILFEKAGQTYKVALLDDLDADMVSLYRQGDFVDLCRGPHLMKTSQVKAVELMKQAGAYWRGDEKNKMLQRIYGISFPDKKELSSYLQMIEEAKERDHRKLGKDLELFETSQEVGPGLILMTPKGGRVRYQVEEFWKKEHYKNGYEIVYTPHIGRSLLWETSGHLDFYKEGMYSPMDIDGEDYYVKPMNCPFHVMLYKSKKRSYREFPFRWAELGTVYRYEKSGTLHGLLRVRGFTQDDAHIFCRIDQMKDEIKRTFDFSMYMLKSFGFTDYNIYLSTKPEKAVGTDEIWEKAEQALQTTLDASDMPYALNEGDGAFYGPKIDIAVKDAIGREWQLSTIQLDFNLPQRFDLSYVGSDGCEHQPIMLHRALLGSLERFLGILIEHYKGALPVWLSPVQIILINVSDDEAPYTEELAQKMKETDIRVELDSRNETMGYRIREAVTQKVPYVGVIGKKEVEQQTISIRKRGEQKSTMMRIDEFLSMLRQEMRS
jgi:threonyl-tRNA synthetase